ncbi:MAG: asparaginase [Betaproteobacteria bacterium]|nr:MAG: asparaginase [Betaproteobacteria bacterium]
MSAVPRPSVHVLATGGSISGLGPHRLDYTLYPELGQRLSVEQMLARIPEAGEIAEVTAENVLQVGSPSIGPTEWLQLAQRINALFSSARPPQGVVVTHGTATLEETAYFLHLTVKSERPVVVTGAMRPPSALGTDADLNLLDAIRLAACPEAAGRGVLTVLNNEIQSARDVTKSNAFRVDTFDSRDFGLLGYVDSDARVVFYRNVTRLHTTAAPFDVRGKRGLPRVDIIYAYAGADGVLIDALRQHGTDGLVLAGFGGGSYPGAFFEAGKRAVQAGIPVVLATRSTAGRVIMTPQKASAGFIVSDDLLPQKARILLTLALTVTREREALQELFFRY